MVEGLSLDCERFCKCVPHRGCGCKTHIRSRLGPWAHHVRMSEAFLSAVLKMELCQSFCKRAWSPCVCFCSRASLLPKIGRLSSCLELLARAGSVISPGP